jgi:hypothetical protein
MSRVVVVALIVLGFGPSAIDLMCGWECDRPATTTARPSCHETTAATLAWSAHHDCGGHASAAPLPAMPSLAISTLPAASAPVFSGDVRLISTAAAPLSVAHHGFSPPLAVLRI